jgi:hypothetical protein
MHIRQTEVAADLAPVRASKFAAPEDQSVVDQTAVLLIFEQPDDRLIEVVAHRRSEFQFHPGAARGSIADGEQSFAIVELGEHVIPDNPVVVLAQVGEEVIGLGIVA